MTNEQREAIELLERIHASYFLSGMIEQTNYIVDKAYETDKAIDTVLSLIKEQQGEIDLIKEYTHQEISHYTETIKDFIDDDKEGNKHYIEELKEEREHWRDIEKILQNKPKEELYMNWWKYGLYE